MYVLITEAIFALDWSWDTNINHLHIKFNQFKARNNRVLITRHVRNLGRRF